MGARDFIFGIIDDLFGNRAAFGYKIDLTEPIDYYSLIITLVIILGIVGFSVASIAPILIDGNSSPVANLESDSPSFEVSAGDAVVLDASGSTDEDGDDLSYDYDIDADGEYEVVGQSGPTYSRTYESNGTYFVSVQVRDEQNATDTANTTVRVNDLPTTEGITAAQDDDKLDITVDMSEQLDSLSVAVENDSETETLNIDEFVRDGTSYVSQYDVEESGKYGVSVISAVDKNGGSIEEESQTVTETVDLDTPRLNGGEVVSPTQVDVLIYDRTTSVDLDSVDIQDFDVEGSTAESLGSVQPIRPGLARVEIELGEELDESETVVAVAESGAIQDEKGNVLRDGSPFHASVVSTEDEDEASPRMEDVSLKNYFTISVVFADDGSGVDSSTISRTDFSVNDRTPEEIRTTPVNRSASRVDLLFVNRLQESPADVRLTGQVSDLSGNRLEDASLTLTGIDTRAPTVTEFEASNTFGYQVYTSFRTDEALGSLNVTAGQSRYQLARFSEERINNDTYEYESATPISLFGEHEVAIQNLSDRKGNNESDIESTVVSVDRDWQMSGANKRQSGLVETEKLSNPSRAWENDQPSQPVVSTPAVVDDYVFAGAVDGNLYRINRTNGQQDWVYSSSDSIQFSPAVYNQTVMFVNDAGKIEAIDGISKQQLWAYQIENVESDPVASDGVLYVTGDNETLTAINTTTGDAMWSTIVGSAATGAAVSSDGVVVGTEDGDIYNVDKEDGSASTIGSINATPTGIAVQDQRVYVTGGESLKSVTTSGSSSWVESFNLSASPPSTDGEQVYVGLEDSSVAAVSTSGAEQWRYNTSETLGITGDVQSRPSVTNSSVIVTVGSEHIVSINSTGQNSNWNANADGINGAPAVLDSEVYFGTERETVVSSR